MIVRFCADIIVLKVLLAVEGDHLWFDFAVFNIYLVAAKNDWNVLTNANEIFVPVGNILVGESAGNIKHNYGALPLNVVSITKSSKLAKELRERQQRKEKIPFPDQQYPIH